MSLTLKKIFSIILSTFLLGGSPFVFADIEQDRAEGIAWVLKNQNGDGSWGTDGAKVATTSESLAALSHSGMTQNFFYSRALSWLVNYKTESIDSLARKIIALEDANFDTMEMGFINELMNLRNNEMAWGSFNGFDSGFPDTSLALQAILLSGVAYSDIATSISRITGAQYGGNYGWSYMGGSLGKGKHQQIMPTAYNLITLSAYQQTGNNVASYIKRALNWLVIDKQQPDGSFLDNASVSTGAVLSTALSYLAIKASHTAGITVPGSDIALVNAQNYLLQQQLMNGSWNNNALHTGLVLRTFPATTLIDTDFDGIANSVEVILETDPNISDTREFINSNGLDPDSLNSSLLNVAPIVLEISKDQSFTYTPLLIGGTPNFNWEKITGSLPTGISIEATGTGVISGTPTQAGKYQSMINVIDSKNVSFNFPISILVIAMDDLDTDTDGDGLWSSYEIAHGSDPLNKNSTSSAQVIDSDKDGMPDTWEQTHNFDPNDKNDASLDSDNDGWSNVVEFQRGTDPKVPNKPVLGTDVVSLLEDTSINFNITNNDQDGVLSTLAVVSTVWHGVLTNNGSGSFTYQPHVNYHGSDTFTYKLCGTNGLCSTSAVQITVNSVNDAPFVNVGADRSADAREIVNLTSTSNDVDGAIILYDWVQLTGTPVAINGANSTSADFIAPVLTAEEILKFSLTVTDNNGAIATDEINIIVPIAKDKDGDGYDDDEDAFPDDPTEWLDTDGDGVGNNTDLDDDGDGMSDIDELAIGRNPLVNENLIIIIINSVLLN